MANAITMVSLASLAEDTSLALLHNDLLTKAEFSAESWLEAPCWLANKTLKCSASIESTAKHTVTTALIYQKPNTQINEA